MTPGKQSTEFWLTLAVLAMALLNGTDFVNVPWDEFGWIAGLAGIYTGGRSFVKAKDK